MKRMFGLLVSLFVIYFIIQFIFNFFGEGHFIEYVIYTNDGNIGVSEKLNLNTGETNNYYFEITYNGTMIPFKIYNVYGRKEKILKNVIIYKSSNYICASLILRHDKNPSDIKCSSNETVYFYSSIIGKDEGLDRLIFSDNYDKTKYTNNLTGANTLDRVTYYPNNFVKKDYILLDDYKGAYLLNNNFANNIKFVNLFSKDIYDSKIKTIYKNNYVIADYNVDSNFDIFYLTNIKKGDKIAIKSDFNISFNSIIQGNVKNKIYILDLENRKQYFLNISTKKVELIASSSEMGKFYKNGKWEEITVNEMVENKIIFKDDYLSSLNGVNYSKVILIGNKDHGTYYVFEKNGKMYDVYSIYNHNIKNYLFSTSDMEKVIIRDKYIYYLNNADLMVFGYNYGNRKIATNNEYLYNSSLNYYVY